MPYRYQIEARGVFVRWTGRVTGAEMLVYIADIHAHERLDEFRYELHDFSGCSSVDLSGDHVETIAALDAAAALTNPDMKIAVVSGDPVIADGVAQYIRSGYSPYPMELFPQVEAARRWLGA